MQIVRGIQVGEKREKRMKEDSWNG